MKRISKFLTAFFLAAALLPAAGCSSPPIDAGQMLTDQDITDKANAAIYSDPKTKDGEIYVSTIRGIVYLKGSVGSQTAMDQAVQHARSASGAMGVKNELTIK